MIEIGKAPLIVGSGIAGLYVALRLHELGLRPEIVTKSRLEESNTRYAQGGIAAAVGPGDGVALHWQDTLRAGAGLVDRAAARLLTREAPARIADLVRLGVPFDTIEGQIVLGREAAHRRARILHAGGDATGLQLEETLRDRVIAAGIAVRERTVLRRILLRHRSVRVVLSDPGGRSPESLGDRPLVLATGGAGRLFRESSNPPVATGEGIAIAFRAGLWITDMEFVQFHPTTFYRTGAPRFLLTEALRGEGALLRNERGERFMPKYHPDAELAPRDVVSRAIDTEMKRTQARSVLLDATTIPSERLFARFPTICRFLARYGLDPSRDPIPVTPAAHYTIGGIATDHAGRTSAPGVYACGEVAATGVHGANRLASNSLLEGLVFGEHVARDLARPRRPLFPAPARSRRLRLLVGEGHAPDRRAEEEVRAILWTEVGIVRSGRGLRRAAKRLGGFVQRFEPTEREGLPSATANAALTALLMTRAALARTESRGAHFRSDFPRPRRAWRVHLGLRRLTPR